MRFAVPIVIALAACGRFGFDPHGAGINGDDMQPPTGDGGATDDSLTSTSSDGADGALPNGQWTVFSPGLPAIDYYAAWSFGPNRVWVGGANGDVRMFDGSTWVQKAGPTTDVYMMWGVVETDLWEVGRLCEVRRWNGATWVSVAVPGCTNKTYFAVAGLTATDVWIAGVGGSLEHWVSGTFTSMPQAGNVDLWAVWPVSASEAYFVGTKGTILHWTGTVADESVGQNIILASVWGVGNEVWVVGGGGVIYHKVGTGAWQSVTSPTTSFLYQVFGTSASDVWAIGDLGVVLHYNGSTWTQVTVPATTSLRWIAAVPGGGLRMAGHGGTILTHP